MQDMTNLTTVSSARTVGTVLLCDDDTPTIDGTFLSFGKLIPSRKIEGLSHFSQVVKDVVVRNRDLFVIFSDAPSMAYLSIQSPKDVEGDDKEAETLD